MKVVCLRAVGVCSLLLGVASFAAAQENTIYKDLLSKGIPLSNTKTAKLPEPVMGDGLDEAAQQAVIKKIAPSPQLVNEFAEGAKSAPFNLILKDNDIPGSKPEDSIGRRVDLYFVAQGKLATIEDKNFMGQQIKQGQKAKRGNADFLTDQELKERSLTVIDTKTLRERYAHIDIPLFGQAKVSGTGRGMQSIGSDSTFVAFLLDPKLANDSKYPNQWQPGTQKNGVLVWGNPLPYAGAGGYAKATELKGPIPRIFVEYHLAFDEPHGWFGGGTNLITKLPQQYQSDVRGFRNDIKEFEKNQAAGAQPAMANQPGAGAKAN
jgi:hypothetical protein